MPIPISQILRTTSVSGNYVSYDRQVPSLTEVRNARANLFEGSQAQVLYSGAFVSGIYYADGSSKALFYNNSGVLTRTDYTLVNPSRVYRKDFVYLNNGSLSGVLESLT